MIVSSMRTAIREMFGDIDSAQFTNSQILTYLNWALAQVAQKLELTRNTTTVNALDGSTVEGIGGVALPVDFIREIDVRWNGVKLERKRFDELFEDQDSIILTADTPTHYAIVPVERTTGNRRMVFYPYQSLTQAATIKINYIGRPADLVADGDSPMLPESLHFALILYTCYLMAAAEQDNERSMFFKYQYQDQINDWSSNLYEVGYNENPRVREDAPPLYDLYS